MPGVDIVLPKSSVVAFRSDLDLTGLAVEFLDDALAAEPGLVEFSSVFRYVGISERDEVFANYKESCSKSGIAQDAASGDRGFDFGGVAEDDNSQTTGDGK